MTDVYKPLDPIALKLGPLEIHWYGVIIALGIFVAIFLSMKEAEKEESMKIPLSIWRFGRFQ